MTLFVDTSVWSLALRRDTPPASPEIERLARALRAGEIVVSTGLVLQELLQGFSGPRQREDILSRFAALPFVSPERRDHIEAAELRNVCRRGGVQVGTVDALLAQICLRHGLTMLAADQDFHHVARVSGLVVFR